MACTSRAPATCTASDSTFNANTSAGGGAIGSAGTVKLNAVTVSANAAGSSKGGGIWREGGSFTIAGSILAANTATTGPNCYGSPALAGTNIVQSTTGCTSSGGAALAVDPKLGALGDNGGSTLTRLPGVGSPAIDAYAPACVTTVDQRGLSRSPTPGGKCDIGSVEVDPITVDVTLTTSAPPRSPACDEGTVCVGTGVSSVPIDRIPSAALVAETDPDADPTGFKRTFLERTDAARLGFKRTDLLSSPVSELTVEDLGFKRTGFKRTGFKRTSILDQVLLSQIPLYLAGGRTWEDLLTGTEFDGVPLQNVTLGDVVELPQIQALTVGEADFISTALQGLSGAALALAPLNLDDIPIGDDPNPLTGWCDFLTTQSQGGCADLEIDPNDPATAAGVGLVTLELSGVKIEDIPLEDIGFKRTDVTGTYLADIGFKRTDLSGGRIGQVDVRQVGPVDALFDCAKIACNGTVTLAGAQDAGAIRDGATIGELLEYLSAHPEAQGLNILDLLLILTPVVFPGEAVAIEQIDLRATPLQNLSDPLEAPATFTATITSGGGSPADTTVDLTLPPGFEPVAGSAAFDGAPIADGSRDGQTLTFRRTSLAVGQHTLVVNARAGIDLGSKEASVDVRATAGSQAVTDSATASVLVVVESFEKNGAPDDFRSLNPGAVNVAHLSSSYDRDLYSFYVSPDDASRNRTTRLDLSNLTGDYDLVLYGPSAVSLRGDAPRARLQPVDDTGLDIDPTADQVAPDVQSDVPLTPPPDCGVPGTQQSCEPYAVSAQRGTKNELIESGTLIAGTYWVEVRGYNGAFGPEPYVVRRIDAQGEPLGACAPRSSSSAAPGPLVTYPAGITAATATGHMLVPEGRFRQQYGDTETQSVLDALSAVAAASSAAVVRIDADPGVKAAYDAWDAEPCSVDASNNVVRAIGKLLDQLEAQSPNAASVTLLGTHVMTPFGLVPDGTTVANESSYDPGVSAGQDTSLTAALAGRLRPDRQPVRHLGRVCDQRSRALRPRAGGGPVGGEPRRHPQCPPAVRRLRRCPGSVHHHLGVRVGLRLHR